MTNDEARALISAVIGEVAPEVDVDSVRPGETLQEALDLDSMDFLNVVIGVHARTGIDIPERDYQRISTLEGFIAYLTSAT